MYQFAAATIICVGLLALVAWWRNKAPSSAVPASALQPSVVADVLTLRHAGRTIEAIKLVREHTGLGLSAAKQAVEALARSGAPLKSAAAALEAIAPEVLTLLKQAQPIEAIKLVRAHTGCGLKEAKDLVEALAAQAQLKRERAS
jgi:ribosomal protein L7/L12